MGKKKRTKHPMEKYAHRAIESLKRRFLSADHLRTTVAFVDSEGMLGYQPAAPGGLPPNYAHIAVQARLILQRIHTEAVVIAGETWFAPPGGRRPRDHPSRREALYCVVQYRTGGGFTRFFEIKRRGGVARLEPLSGEFMAAKVPWERFRPYENLPHTGTGKMQCDTRWN